MPSMEHREGGKSLDVLQQVREQVIAHTLVSTKNLISYLRNQTLILLLPIKLRLPHSCLLHHYIMLREAKICFISFQVGGR